LLALWGLPNPIIEAVAMHHQPARCAETGFSPTIAVHAADVFAHEFSENSAEILLPQLDTALLTGFAGRIECWRDSCQEKIEA
jgi:HD-like signal output (HDOD) protein